MVSRSMYEGLLVLAIAGMIYALSYGSLEGMRDYFTLLGLTAFAGLMARLFRDIFVRDDEMPGPIWRLWRRRTDRPPS